MYKIVRRSTSGETRVPPQIIIAIPHSWLRETIFQMLCGEGAQISCVATFDELLEQMTEETDVVLIDLFGFPLYYHDLIQHLKQRVTNVSLIGLFSIDNLDYRDAVMRAGVNMVIAKKDVDSELIPSLIRIFEGRHCNKYIQYLLSRQDSFVTLMQKGVKCMDHDRDKTPGGPKWSRRTFLKSSAAAAAVTGVALANPGQRVLQALEQTNPQAAAQAAQGEEIFNGVCRPNCGNSCRLNVHVRDGRVVKTSMGKMPDPRYNRICLRGLSHAQRMYSQNRIKYPMKRVGERGEGKWERISWEEAINTIVEKFNGIRKQYGNQAVSFTSCSGSYGILSCPMSGHYVRLKNAMEATSIGSSVDVAFSKGINSVIGGGLWWNSNEPTDYKNARTIIAWGTNPVDAWLHSWHFIADAIENGAKLIVIDPVFTPTAAKADMYVPVRPASDAALILAMMQVIIEENLTDKPFMLAHTVAPFLVRSDNKHFLRRSDLTGKAVAQGEKDPYIVWDQTANQARPGDEVEMPALEGTFNINGISVTTAFSLLKELAYQYTPEKAEKLTDVSPEVTRTLARLYATNTPSTIIPGFGNDRYTNGNIQGHALGALAAITGNIGKPGASVGMFEPQNPLFPFLNFAEFAYPDGKRSKSVTVLKLREVMETGMYMGKPHPIKALFVHHGNPVNTMANQNDWLNHIIPKLEFIVVADIDMGDTAQYADILLPVAHWFEQEEYVLTGNNTVMQFNEKAVEPAFEAKTDMDIVRLLAPGLGVGQYFTQSDEEFMRILLNSDKVRAANITYERLRKEKAIRWMPGSVEKPFIWAEGGKFPTPTGRAEFYIENPTPNTNFGQTFDVDIERLPNFRPPIEAWPENPLYKKYPLVCLMNRERWRVHSQFHNIPWLRELEPEPIVKINPVDANARGIKNGDTVEVYNDRGHVVLKAVVSDGLRPGVINMSRGFQRNQHIAGSFQELTASHLNPYTVNHAYHDTLVEIRKA
ncbi:molybdopterin-dependent oxidoreductase [Desulfitobacterium hafniense]|uniref:molybdopterin-dependent oxidoreductase n=1 Tax=Desulfitobacterium hafniense TaxID=49338 RepID=UPI0003758E4C|nr:molybdopterin-dependent oxidoreductase [Desulfitobacterium hafniense]